MEETGMNYLWSARKRNALGLPWTFTKYAFTEDRLFVTTGLLKTVEDEVRLYRILDISLSRTLLQKIFGMGTIAISSAASAGRAFRSAGAQIPVLPCACLRIKTYTSPANGIFT